MMLVEENSFVTLEDLKTQCDMFLFLLVWQKHVCVSDFPDEVLMFLLMCRCKDPQAPESQPWSRLRG